MNLLYPKIQSSHLPRIIGISLIGAITAGIYGIAHDQITYSISEEYFTKLKFNQFQFADFGLPARLFVAEIGFLATWWVGIIAGWFLARIAAPKWPAKTALKKCLQAFFVMIATAFLAAVFGYALGAFHSGDYSDWQEFTHLLALNDTSAFVQVAYIHNSSYIGGVIGLVLSIFLLSRIR
jgi:hypothetical protein